MDTNKIDHSTIYMISTSNDGGVMGFPFLNQRLRQSAVNIILIDPCVIFFLRIETFCDLLWHWDCRAHSHELTSTAHQ